MFSGLLVSVKVDMLGSGSPDPSVLPNKKDSDAPSTDDGAEGEAGGCTKTNAISGSVALRPEVGTIDVTDLATNIGHCQNNLGIVSINILWDLCVNGRLTAFFSFV